MTTHLRPTSDEGGCFYICGTDEYGVEHFFNEKTKKFSLCMHGIEVGCRYALYDILDEADAVAASIGELREVGWGHMGQHMWGRQYRNLFNWWKSRAGKADCSESLAYRGDDLARVTFLDGILLTEYMELRGEESKLNPEDHASYRASVIVDGDVREFRSFGGVVRLVGELLQEQMEETHGG